MNAELVLCMVRYSRILQVNNEIWEDVVRNALTFPKL